MKFLFDTNVLLDVIMRRPMFFEPAAKAWELAETKRINTVVCAVSLTTVHYIVRSYSSQSAADEGVRIIHRVFPIGAVDTDTIGAAIGSGNPDFEDAVQAACGKRAAATHVITRDARGFTDSGLAVLTPMQLIESVGDRIS